MAPLQEKKEDRLFVIREADLRKFAMNVSAAQTITFTTLFDLTVGYEEAEAIGQGLGDFFQQMEGWLNDHTGHPELGRPMIPKLIVDALAAQMFDLAMRQRWNQGGLDGDPPTWNDEVNPPNADQKDEWRSGARGHLMNIWDDLVTYFSCQGVLWWTRLSEDDCKNLVSFIENCDATAEVESVMPLLREAASAGGRA